MFHFVLTSSSESRPSPNIPENASSAAPARRPASLTQMEPSMSVVVQRPGELPEQYERFAKPDQAAKCKAMIERSEPAWKVWLS